MKLSRRAALMAATALALPALVGAAPSGSWAPAASATIHPGVQTTTAGAQCTANFVFVSGDDVLIGQAAHCSGEGESTDTDGCAVGSLPLGTPVLIQGASRPGELVYSSWIAMAEAEEDNATICSYNDFALVRVDPADHDKVNPSLPVFGAPSGTDNNGAGMGEEVYTYGNSGLRGGIEQLSPHVGFSLGTDASGWTTTIFTVTPGLPGDSGSAVLSGSGEALGILVTLGLAPLPGSNGVTSLNKALAYANSHLDSNHVTAPVVLEDGTEQFSGSILSIFGGLLG